MNNNIIAGLILSAIGILILINRKTKQNNLIYKKENLKLPYKEISLPVKKWSMPIKGKPYERFFNAATLTYSLPENLLARVAYQESHFRPDIITGKVRSRKGALGIMQIMPIWHPNVDPLDPKAAIQYAAQYISKLYKQFGSWSLALAAYNWGPGNLANKGFNNAPLETRNYVSSIINDLNLV